MHSRLESFLWSGTVLHVIQILNFLQFLEFLMISDVRIVASQTNQKVHETQYDQ